MTPKRYIFSFLTLLIVLLPILVSADSSGLGCEKAVDAFLASPTEQTLRILSRIDRAGCWPVIESSNAKLDHLNRWVEAGDPVAAQYLAEHVKRLDSGNLEDALIALGQFSERDMEHLLVFAHRGLLSKHELVDALTMLPLALSDNPPSQLRSLELRRSKIRAVRRKDLSEQRVLALSAIDNFESEIRSKNPETAK